MPITSHHLKYAPAATLSTVDTLLSDAEADPARADLWPRVNALRPVLGGEDAITLVKSMGSSDAARDAIRTRSLGRARRPAHLLLVE